MANLDRHSVMQYSPLTLAFLGDAVYEQLVRERLVNCVYGYIGASIFGGQGCGAVGGQGINEVDEALKLQNPKVTVFGNDVLVKYEVMR